MNRAKTMGIAPAETECLNLSEMLQLYREKIERNDILSNPTPVEYCFKQEITKIFGKGG